jgi:uncharacterized metal-binding protein YceD (DUF177 family)
VSEFERFYDLRHLPSGAQQLEAGAAECAALAARFALVRIERLVAEVTLMREGPVVLATGRLKAEVVQSCAVSGEDLAVSIDEPVALRFVPPAATPGEDEIELDSAGPDEIELDGTRFDLGEALAQSLALAIDPFAIGPAAEEARHRAGLLAEGEDGPFAALAALRKPDGSSN